MRERYGNGAGAGADVEDPMRRGGVEVAEDRFDEVFGLGAGDEDGGCYAEREAVELLLAGDVLEGLAGEAALDQVVVE